MSQQLYILITFYLQISKTHLENRFQNRSIVYSAGTGFPPYETAILPTGETYLDNMLDILHEFKVFLNN